MVVVTIFNPANLLTRIQNAGFEVRDFEPPSHAVLRRRDVDRVLDLNDIEHFVRLVPEAFRHEAQVCDMVVRAVEQTRDRWSADTRIYLAMQHGLEPWE